MVRFGLAVPLPNNPNQWIIPALLSSSSTAPFGWFAPPDDATQLRLLFSIDGIAEDCVAEDTLVYDTSELSAGFLPIGAFHRIAAAALGSSANHKSGAELALFRDRAYICFVEELLVLRYAPSESSIVVQLYSNGKAGSGALVLDRLRTIVSTELAIYQNIRACNTPWIRPRHHGL